MVGQRGTPIYEQAPLTFCELESRLATLKGHTFYGEFADSKYREDGAER